MNIWNKVLLVLIFLTALFYVVLVSNRFNLAKEWEEKLAKQDNEIQNLTDAVAKLKIDLYGEPLKAAETWDDMGLVAKMEKINALNPGKVWTDCRPANVEGLEGNDVLTAHFTIPPTGIARQYGEMKLGANDLIYVFDSGFSADTENTDPNASGTGAATEVQKAQFLGFFTVGEITDPGDFTLQSVGTVTDDQKKRIQDSLDSGRSWTIYEDRLPVDSPNDIAYWLEKEPDSPFAKTLSDEDKAYFLQKSLSFDELNIAVDAAAGETSQDELIARLNGLMIPENKRISDNYEAVLLRKTQEMDSLNVFIARSAKSIENLNRVIGDQLAMIGLDAVPEEIVTKLGQEGADILAAILPQAKAAFNSPTFIVKKDQAAAKLAVMEKERDMVKSRLDLSLDCVKKIGQRLDYLVKENARLATEIAKAQFEASDKIIQKSENVTVQVNPDSVMNVNPLRFED